MHKYIRSITLLLAALLLFPGMAQAWQPYDTFYVSNGTGGAGTRVFWMQDVYTVSHTAVGQGEQAMKQPADLFIAADDHLYIADKGNSRIIELNRDGEWIRQVGVAEGEGKLKAPEGVFVRPNGDIYVADTGNQRIAVFNKQGMFVKEYLKPTDGLMPASYFFVPVKITVDGRGVMYIVSKGSYQGMVRMSGESGGFTGFFGSNKTSGTWMDRLKRNLFTKEQLAKEELKRPTELSNVTMDHDGYILATTTGVLNNQIKKLTAAGINRFDSLKTARFSVSDQMVDVAADNQHFFYVLDRMEGKWDTMISIYSPGGTQLFTFGKSQKDPQQRGVLSYPISIGIDSENRLWVLDSDQSLVQAYDRTEFGDAVLTAAADYYSGDYEKSEVNWNKVKSLNEIINLTYLGLGEVAQKQERTEDALAYFKMSYDNEGYSEAYWTYRLAWIQQYFGYALGGLVLLWLLYRYGIRRLIQLSSGHLPKPVQRIVRELKDAWYTMFHPFEGFYRIKGTKLSVITMAILILLLVLMKTAILYWMGFIFNPVNLNRIKLNSELLSFLTPFLAWVVANYLVSTVKDGEGRFRDVVQSSLYAIVPYIVLSLPIVALSNMLVLEEGILVSSLRTVMWMWICALFIISSQVIHNFEFMENIKMSSITVVTVGILFLFITVTTGLTYNAYDFFYQLYKEVRLLG